MSTSRPLEDNGAGFGVCDSSRGSLREQEREQAAADRGWLAAALHADTQSMVTSDEARRLLPELAAAMLCAGDEPAGPMLWRVLASQVDDGAERRRRIVERWKSEAITACHASSGSEHDVCEGAIWPAACDVHRFAAAFKDCRRAIAAARFAEPAEPQAES